MPSYALCLTVHRLMLSVHLGCHAEERIAPQAVEVEIKCYFERQPEVAARDDGDFLCYDQMAERLLALCAGREFRFIEFLAGELLAELRHYVDATLPANAPIIKLWINARKLDVPVDAIAGGCSVTLSELPGGVPL